MILTMRKNLVIGVLMFLSAFAVKAQSENRELSTKKREKSLSLVFGVCPTADILELELKEDYLEIEYLCGGVYYEMGIRNEVVMYIETRANENTVPYDKIRKKLEKDHADWLLDEVSEIFTSDTSFLKVEVIKDGLEQNLFFTTDGKWYKPTSLAVSDHWSREDLEKSGFYENAAYNYSRPDKIYELPSLLVEISGHTLSHEKTVLCVQDELGAVFEYDLDKGELKNIFRFTDIGDFEAITIKENQVYVLRSDGTIFSFDYKNRKSIETVILPINALNFESLTYDKSSGKFLVVSKDARLNDPESSRVIYEIANDAFSKPSVYKKIDVQGLNQFINAKLEDGKSKSLMFNPSDIAIHPITKDIYVLSASDRVLAVYDKNGLKDVYPLPAEVYFKPEGITFYENGDMLISSEGDKKGIIGGSLMLLKNKIQ